jgi:O-acetyl-ADP-ribose deacetylase (regulator of RNase III)
MTEKIIHLAAEALGPLNSGETAKPLQITILQGNLITQDVDAIVNAANGRLLGGDGVDGQIHNAAGPQLLAECRTLGGCATGDAKTTKGYNLNARHVIHAVGPAYPIERDDPNDPEYLAECAEAASKLASCHKSILREARKHQFKSIAIPAISTGIFGYPTEKAALVAREAVYNDLQQNGKGSLTEIRFVLWEPEKFDIYAKVFN